MRYALDAVLFVYVLSPRASFPWTGKYYIIASSISGIPYLCSGEVFHADGFIISYHVPIIFFAGLQTKSASKWSDELCLYHSVHAILFAKSSYVCVSGGKKCAFFRNLWRALFSFYLRFEIHLFALLPTHLFSQNAPS